LLHTLALIDGSITGESPTTLQTGNLRATQPKRLVVRYVLSMVFCPTLNFYPRPKLKYVLSRLPQGALYTIERNLTLASFD